MKLTIKRDEFLRALKVAKDIADAKSTMPLVAHVLLTATSDGLSVRATDLIVSMSADLEAEVKDPGSATANARDLAALVGSLPTGKVTLESLDNHRLRVRAGIKADYKLAGLNPEHFPPVHRLEDNATFSMIDGGALHRALECTTFATCADETRFGMCGVHVETENDRALFVSSDGYRMALHRSEAMLDVGDGITIPTEACNLIARICPLSGDVGIHVKRDGDRAWLFVTTGGIDLAVNLITADFVPWRMMMREKHASVTTIPTESLRSALSRVRLLSKRGFGTRVKINNKSITMYPESAERGSGSEVVDCDVEGETLEVGLSAQLLADFVARVADEAPTQLCMANAEDPVWIEAGDVAGVLMPVRLEVIKNG